MPIFPLPVFLATLRLGQPFPQIDAPFTHHVRDSEGRVLGDGQINQIWLQLLISLWNRTGAAQGVDSEDALLSSFTTTESSQIEDARHESALALLIQHQVRNEIERLGLDQPPARLEVDPLSALLFSGSSAAGVEASDWCMNVFADELGIVLSSEPCGSLFTNEA